MLPTQIEKLARAKLKTSGLTLKDAKQLGIKILSSKQLTKLHPKFKGAALYFTYHDIEQRPLKKFHRVRLLEQIPGAFGEVSDRRYIQPDDTPPMIYFPTGVNWRAKLKDPNTTILLTEGELKAACASKHGFACIGFGGVSSWRSKKMAWSFHPMLEKIPWEKRDVVICFDADYMSNPTVAAEVSKLCRALSARGALPAVALIPEIPEAPKTGLDDFIVARGVEEFKEVLETAEMSELARDLWDFNSRFAYVLDPAVVYDLDRQTLYSPDKFTKHIFANEWSTEITANGPKTVQIAKKWVDWPMRTNFESFTYLPGAPSIIEGMVNQWEGLAVDPKKGSVKLWHKLLDILFHGANPKHRKWFEQWCLYPLRHPGTKILSAVCLWSETQGIGKSFVGETLDGVYGANGKIVSQDEFEDFWNSWAKNKQFIMLDDLDTLQDKAKVTAVFKKKITQREMEIKEKYINQYTLPDFTNYLITSNQPNALKIDESDRRFFVHEVPGDKVKVAKILASGFFDEFAAWIGYHSLKKDGPGLGALLHYAIHDMSYKGFDPTKPPPITEAKRAMYEETLSELDTWILKLQEDPEGTLRVDRVRNRKDLFTPEEIRALYMATDPVRKVTSNHVGRRLSAGGFKRATDSGQLKIQGKNLRLYIIRNKDKWLRASTEVMRQHVEQGRKF